MRNKYEDNCQKTTQMPVCASTVYNNKEPSRSSCEGMKKKMNRKMPERRRNYIYTKIKI